MIVIIGCGGHARSVADVLLNNQKLRDEKNEDFYFVDENAKPEERIFGRNVYSHVVDESNYVILAIGDNEKRKQYYERQVSFSYLNLISQDAYIGTETHMGDGNFIAHRAYVGPECIIGKGNIINTGASIDHECKIGNFSHIAVGATLAGKVVIGDRVFVGAGATIIDGIQIGDDIVIGAGSTVVSDLMVPGVYIGTPARRKK